MPGKSQAMRTLRKAVAAVRAGMDADLILYCGPVGNRGDTLLRQKIKKLGKRRNAVLFLSTYGGTANVAYRIARTIQQSYKKFTLLVSTYCKSAGTLVAIGADELVMTDEAELGPLDVQLYKHDEIGEWTSGLTPIQSLSTLNAEVFKAFESHFLDLRVKSDFQITTRTAAQIATRLTIGCFSPIYSQLDPLRLGEIYRSILIAEHYGARLARNNCLNKDAIAKLISDYPSHDFIIDRQEAGKLFKVVRAPSPSESAVARALGPVIRDRLRVNDPLVPPLVDFISEEDFKDEKGSDNEEQEVRHATNAKENGEVPAPARQDRADAVGANGKTPTEKSKRVRRAKRGGPDKGVAVEVNGRRRR